MRIGCFGDSFTWGDEVEDGLDYPALLEREYHARGSPEVDVLNFGNNWYGFHQSYLLWEAVGTKFDLDTVVLGPGAFQEERDTTFNHTGDFEASALHARYILDGHGVRRIDLLGETPYARYRRYYAWWTPEIYRRFDRRPPVFLRCFLPASLVARNPFYYFEGTIEEEAHEIYRRLLRRMAARARRVLLVHHRREIVELGRALDLPNLVSAVATRPLHFPYLAPRGHGSPVANRLLAREVLGLLSGASDPAPRAAGTLDLEPRPFETPSDGAQGVRIECAGKRAGRLYRMGPGGFPEPVEAIDPSATLLAVRGEGQGVLDGVFFPIVGDLPRTATMRSAAGTMEVAIDGAAPLAVLTLPGAKLHLHTHFGLRALLDLGSSQTEGFTIALGGEPLRMADSLFARASGDVLLEEGDGTFDLVIPVPGGERRIPLATW